MKRLCTPAILAAFMLTVVGCHVLPPFPPGAPEGPGCGETGVDYQFTAVTTDPQGDYIAYRFDWGDGCVSDWGGFVPSGTPVTIEYGWADPGIYVVRAQARDILGLKSCWSPGHRIAIGGGSGYPDTVVARLNAGRDPVGIAAGPSGEFVYVAARGNDQMTVIRTSDNMVVDRVDVGSRPHALCVLPDGGYAYVANCGSDDVSVVRLADNAVVATVPVGDFPYIVTPSPDCRYVYVTNRYSGDLSVIRTADNAVVATVDIEPVPWGSTVTNDGEYLYVGGSAGPRVFVIRTSDFTVVDTVFVGAGPEGMSSSPDGEYIYVACHTGNCDIIRVQENIVVASVSIDGYPVDAEPLPGGSHVYVASHVGGTIKAFSTATNEVVWTASGASGPNYMAALPSGNAVYVCCNHEDRVWVIGRSGGEDPQQEPSTLIGQ